MISTPIRIMIRLRLARTQASPIRNRTPEKIRMWDMGTIIAIPPRRVFRPNCPAEVKGPHGREEELKETTSTARAYSVKRA